MTNIICGWCRKEFETKTIIKNPRTDCRDLLSCPHCFHLLPSSKKEPVENSYGVGRLHIHE